MKAPSTNECFYTFYKDTVFSFYFIFQKYLNSVLSHGKSTPLKCHGSGKLCCHLCLILNDHFLSSKFQISMNWKCLITIFIEKKHTKFPNVERLDFCKPMKGTVQSHRTGCREQGWHFCSPLLATSLFLFTIFTIFTLQFSTLLSWGNFKKSIIQLFSTRELFSPSPSLGSILEHPDLSSWRLLR